MKFFRRGDGELFWYSAHLSLENEKTLEARDKETLIAGSEFLVFVAEHDLEI